MDEKTDEELEVVFELGCIKGSLKGRRQTKHGAYRQFKILANKLRIDLSDQPPEDTIAENKIDQFYSNQVSRVQSYLLEHKTNYVQKIFSIGDHLGQLLIILSTFNDVFRKNEIRSTQDIQRLPKLVTKLQILAKCVGIDMTEELSKVNDHENFDADDIEILKLELMKKLCKRGNKPTEIAVNTKRSEVDSTRIITDDYWAISLVRLPDSGDSQHAFLVLEGTISNTSMIWFVDFVATKDGKVRKYYYTSCSSPPDRLLLKCNAPLLKINKSDRWLNKTWSITKGTAQNMIQCIEEWQKDPPKYTVLGDSKLAASSGKPNSHNCFTFARMILLDLKDENIKIPEDTLEKWICSITSWRLVDNKHISKWWTLVRFSPLTAILAGAVIAHMLLKRR